MNKNIIEIAKEAKEAFLKAMNLDDNVKNLIGPGVERKILFTAYHNKNINDQRLMELGIERAENFNHVKKLLLK